MSGNSASSSYSDLTSSEGSCASAGIAVESKSLQQQQPAPTESPSFDPTAAQGMKQYGITYETYGSRIVIRNYGSREQ